MSSSAVVSQEQWSSRYGFLLASVGFAVGLGNIWRFPYVTGQNGGSAFLFIYLAAALIIGLPLLITELSIGRRGKSSAPGSILNVAIAIVIESARFAKSTERQALWVSPRHPRVSNPFFQVRTPRIAHQLLRE